MWPLERGGVFLAERGGHGGKGEFSCRFSETVFSAPRIGVRGISMHSACIRRRMEWTSAELKRCQKKKVPVEIGLELNPHTAVEIFS